jgi:Cys-rich repeat protein
MDAAVAEGGTDSGTGAGGGPDADVGCVQDSDCQDGELAVCNGRNGECSYFDDILCEPCTGDGECPGNGFCYEDNAQQIRYCAAPCVRAVECPEGFKCIDGPSARRLCVPDSEQCTGFGSECDFRVCDDTLICDPDTGGCVQCKGDGDCATGACNDENRCVGCAGDDDCPGGRCDTEINECVQCLTDPDCGGGRCNPDTSRCVQCLGDGDCSNGRCRQESLSCVECLEDSDCPGERCNSGNRCVECLENSDCGQDQACSGEQCVDLSVCDSDDDCLETCNLDRGRCECLPILGLGCGPAEVCCTIFTEDTNVCLVPEEC